MAVGLAVFAAAPGWAAGETAVETWAAGPMALHPRTLTVADVGSGSAVIGVDLSALPKDTRIYSARLLVSRGGIGGNGEGALETNEAFPLKSAYRVGGQVVLADQALPIPAPWYDHFDAVEVVRRWVEGGSPNHGLYVRSLAGWRPDGTRLEIAYQGWSEKVPQQVTDLRVFHRAGRRVHGGYHAAPVPGVQASARRSIRLDQHRLGGQQEGPVRHGRC
jgi:hypothetical protein